MTRTRGQPIADRSTGLVVIQRTDKATTGCTRKCRDRGGSGERSSRQFMIAWTKSCVPSLEGEELESAGYRTQASTEACWTRRRVPSCFVITSEAEFPGRGPTKRTSRTLKRAIERYCVPIADYWDCTSASGYCWSSIGSREDSLFFVRTRKPLPAQTLISSDTGQLYAEVRLSSEVFFWQRRFLCKEHNVSTASNYYGATPVSGSAPTNILSIIRITIRGNRTRRKPRS